MKTKHFLITTEDGSAVAVVNAKTNCEFHDKLQVCLREQMDDCSITVPSGAEIINQPIFYMSFANTDVIQTVKCTKIEIY